MVAQLAASGRTEGTQAVGRIRPAEAAAVLQTRGESEPTGDAPCQAGPAPTAELSSEAAVKLVDAGGASPLVQAPLVQAPLVQAPLVQALSLAKRCRIGWHTRIARRCPGRMSKQPGPLSGGTDGDPQAASDMRKAAASRRECSEQSN